MLTASVRAAEIQLMDVANAGVTCCLFVSQLVNSLKKTPKILYLEATYFYLCFFSSEVPIYVLPMPVAVVAQTEIQWDYTAIVFLVNIIPQRNEGNETPPHFLFHQTRRSDMKIVSGEILNPSFALIDIMNGVCFQPP